MCRGRPTASLHRLQSRLVRESVRDKTGFRYHLSGGLELEGGKLSSRLYIYLFSLVAAEVYLSQGAKIIPPPTQYKVSAFVSMAAKNKQK